MALGEAEPMPGAHGGPAHRHEAVLVGGQRRQRREEAEEGQGPVEAARRQDGVAVLDQHDGIGSRSPARDGAQGPRQRVTLARRFAAHEDQPHARRRRQPAEQVLGQPLVRHLDHGGHDRHGLGVACRLLDRGGERGQRGLGGDPVAGDDDERLAGEQLTRGLRFGQRLRLGAPAREHAPPIPERAAQMQRTPAPAPDADPTQDEDEGPGAGAPQARGRVDGEGGESQDVEAEEQGSPSRVARRGCRGVRVGWLSLAVHSRGRQ